MRFSKRGYRASGFSSCLCHQGPWSVSVLSVSISTPVRGEEVTRLPCGRQL